MPKSITVSDSIYQQLEALAVGFDTPERVIERLLKEGGMGQTRTLESRPTLTFNPDEAQFRNLLLVNKRAEVILYFKDGAREIIHWNASRFSPSSKLRANLWSGILRNWKERDIVAAELTVLPVGTSDPDDSVELNIAIAEDIGWTVDEVGRYFEGIEPVSSKDGLLYYHLLTFSENTPDHLKEIAGLNSSFQRQSSVDLGNDSEGV